jgi:choline-sulfatase
MERAIDLDPGVTHYPRWLVNHYQRSRVSDGRAVLRRTPRSRWRASCVAAVLLVSACGSPAPSELPPPSILLVTFDTTRADRIGAYGHAAAGTPTLDRLAAGGVVFDAVSSVSAVTLPSHTSILSGVYPPAHGVRDNAVFVLGEEALLLSEVLSGRGWRSAAFVGGYVLDPRFGLDQGFEVYTAPPPSSEATSPNVERRADAVVSDALGWLAGIEPDERFFVWVHFYDPHAPFDAPKPWSDRVEDPYDAEIAFSDAQLDRLLTGIDRRGLGSNLLVAMTSDHGESLGEHGEQSHGAFIYDAATHVPLVLSGAPVAHLAGTRVERAVSNASLAPTLLALAGIDPGAMPDVILPSLLAEDAEEQPLYLEAYFPYHTFRWHASRGLISGPHKLIEGKQPELYDRSSDPGELRNLAGAEPERLAALRGTLAELLDAHPPLGWAGERAVGSEEQRMLESLGYLEADTSGDPFDPKLPDARERIGDLEQILEAGDLVYRADVIVRNLPEVAFQRREREREARTLREQARDLLTEVTAANPSDPFALNRLANAELVLENYAEAARLLEQVLALAPGGSVAHHNYGSALLGMGRVEEGLRELRTAIEIEPAQPRFYLRLARHYSESGDHARAAEWLEAASPYLHPDDPMATMIRAFRERIALDRARAADAAANGR